jgi:hypothetical protein
MKKSILISALTSSDPERLRRLIISVKSQFNSNFLVRYAVVCNTTDPEYVEQAKAIAYEACWDFYNTESNGMPGKGKNSVLKLFKDERDEDYLFMIDGDDLLYPSALQQLEKVLSTNVDVVGLTSNDIVDRKDYLNLRYAELNDNLKLYSWFDQQEHWTNRDDMKDKVDLSRPLGEQVTPDRIIAISRHAVQFLTCSERLPVYEDYVLSIFALAAKVLGAISYVHIGNTYIYVYDKTNENSTCKKFDKEHNGNWSSHDSVFREEIQPIFDVIKNTTFGEEIPFISISNPKNFSTNDKLKFLGFFFNQ